MKKIAQYLRVSTEVQMNEKTIDSQKVELDTHCRKEGFIIVDTFADDGYSGELLARPALDRLRDDAKAGKFEAVLVHSVDRLSRNHIHAGLVIEEMKKIGVELLFLNAPATDTPEGRLLFDIQSVVAQFEKEKIKERTRRGRLHKANKGQIVGNTPPFGYRYVKRNDVGIYEVVPEHAETVKLMFELYTKKSFTIRGVLKELHRLNIKPPKGGSKWGSSTAVRILSNESYTGVTHYHKTLSYEPLKRRSDTYHRVKNSGRKLRPKSEWIPIPIPAIIDKETFEQAVAKRSTNSQFSLRNTRYSYLLSGLLVHAPCQYRMNSELSGPQRQPFYRCTERQNSFPLPKKCGGSLKADALDALIWETISNVLNKPQFISSYLRKKDRVQGVMVKRLEEKLALLERQLVEIREKEQSIADDYASGAMKPDQIATLMNGLETRRQRILEKKLEAEREVATVTKPVDMNKETFRTTCRLVSKKLSEAPFEVKRAAVKLLVEKISLDKKKATLKVKIPSPFVVASRFEFLTL